MMADKSILSLSYKFLHAVYFLKHLDRRLLYLKRDEERNCLDRVVPSVDVVAHEKVVGVRTPATDPE